MHTFLSTASPDESAPRHWTAIPRLGGQLDATPEDADGRPTPERVLMLAVLQQAILDVGRGDLIGRPGRGMAGGRTAQLEAVRWFASTDRSHLYSFLAICDALEMDAPAIRALLRNPRRTAVATRKAA